MITLQKLSWDNAFSYGENNSIDFSSNPLTQIVGSNGHGKSSIALILEEVLYNKNSKGIKKADVLNRNNKSKSYKIELEFQKDSDHYTVTTVRGSTQSVKLTKNNVDISSHTSTGTYKTLEEVIGYDHKTFAQIVYQSSAASLEFLTATDSNRKKFLIDLLNLSKYVELGDTFKAVLKEVADNITRVSAHTKTVGDWVEKYSKVDLELKYPVEVPVLPKHLIEANTEIRDKIKNIDVINKKIVQNNKYKEILDNIVVEVAGQKPDLDIVKLTQLKTENAKTVRDAESFIAKMTKLGTQCATCMQSIDQDKVAHIVEEHSAAKTHSNIKIKEIDSAVRKYETELAEWTRQVNTKDEYERYYALYDGSLSTEILNKAELQKEIETNDKIIAEAEKEIKASTEYNNKVVAHNAKVELIKSELSDNLEQLNVLQTELSALNSRSALLQVLTKTFSSTGLVAYKIECLVKDLEELTNGYLNDLSAGRFQLGFKVSSSDKLNVVITDHGKDIEINALSGGERARVNVAALLGIRKLMQSLSNTRINLLMLDETIENLDIEGKEKLVEVLLKEEYLNTFVISHGFSHPLLEKVHVVKKNNISRIEYG